jgi:hypothetical protein
MTDFRRCPICGENGWFGALHNANHVCDPTWEARIFTRQYEEEWTTVHGSDAEDAAAKFCENYDAGGDYDIVRRGGDEIEVRKSEGAEIVIVDVEAETVPHYYGHERKSSAKSDAA